jgi:putative hydrolase of the HAD superfamily
MILKIKQYKKNMAIKAITIDFWNTLFDSSNGEKRNAVRMITVVEEVKKHNSEISDELFDASLKKTWENFNKIWFSEQRTPTPIESIEFFWKQLGLPRDDQAVDNIAYVFANSILEHPPLLLPKPEHLFELSKHFKLGIVSDTGFSPGTVLRSLIHKNGIYDYFQEFSFSDETGVSKPHPKAFLTCLSKFDVKPEEAIHIGDIEKTDVKGAKELGMKAIRFSGDPTAWVVKENPAESMADAVLSNWDDIVNYIIENK